MNELPAALRKLADYNQFILWKITEDGKKIPLSAETGAACDPHIPANQLSEADAFAAADFLGVNVGYVFTDRNPFFFLDIDHALQPDGTWSALAQDLIAHAHGCAIEVSQSGEGLHIFGVVTASQLHSNKNAKLGIELYETKRFVALTLNASGNIEASGQACYEYVLPHFPQRTSVAAVAWTDEPDPEWAGPSEDAELLRRMLEGRGSAAAFTGNVASIPQLWNADAGVLGRFFPDAARDFDHSSADAALCSHLAFYTGKNAARIDRMFRTSALYRDKWEQRGDYRAATIGYAIANCTHVYRDPKVLPPDELMTPSVPVDGTAVGSYQLKTAHEQQIYFTGCVYVRQQHRVLMPDGTLLTPSQFRARMGGWVFQLDGVNRATTKNAFEAFTESQVLRWEQADGVCFRPELGPGEIVKSEGLAYANTYVTPNVESIHGDVSPFLNLIYKLTPIEFDRAILLAYMAAEVQYPGVKFQWAPVVQGVQGNGKSFLITVLAKAVGERYTHLPSAQQLTSRFNGWVEGNLLIGVEEICVPGRPGTADTLKPLITNARVEIQSKGIDQRTGDNRANFFFCSNHKDGVVKIRSDRRYCVFFTPQQTAEDLERDGMGGLYFPNLYVWFTKGGFAHCTHYLQHYAIPDELNPAVYAHRAPNTSSTAEAIVTSRGTFEQEIAEAVEEGRSGFCGGWISSCRLTDLVDERLRNEKIPRNRWHLALENLGYVPHPGLPKGRCTSALQTEGARKPTLYILQGHRDIGLVGPAVIEAYQRAQGTAF